MKWHTIPVHQWSQQDVVEWFGEIGLSGLTASVEHNAVNGEDLIALIHEDMLADLGATPIQGRKIKNELAKLGVNVPVSRTTSGISYSSSGPTSPMAANGYPAPGVPVQMHPPQEAMMSKQSSESAELVELKRKLEEEKLKNDLRKEMDLTSRVAATEAAQRAAASSTPLVINNNNNNAATSAAAAGMGRSPSVVVRTRTETYCGCWTCLVFFFFPCIVCCPIDEREVYVRTY